MGKTPKRQKERNVFERERRKQERNGTQKKFDDLVGKRLSILCGDGRHYAGKVLSFRRKGRYTGKHHFRFDYDSNDDTSRDTHIDFSKEMYRPASTDSSPSNSHSDFDVDEMKDLPPLQTTTTSHAEFRAITPNEHLPKTLVANFNKIHQVLKDYLTLLPQTLLPPFDPQNPPDTPDELLDFLFQRPIQLPLSRACPVGHTFPKETSWFFPLLIDLEKQIQMDPEHKIEDGILCGKDLLVRFEKGFKFSSSEKKGRTAVKDLHAKLFGITSKNEKNDSGQKIRNDFRANVIKCGCLKLLPSKEGGKGCDMKKKNNVVKLALFFNVQFAEFVTDYSKPRIPSSRPVVPRAYSSDISDRPNSRPRPVPARLPSAPTIRDPSVPTIRDTFPHSYQDTNHHIPLQYPQHATSYPRQDDSPIRMDSRYSLESNTSSDMDTPPPISPLLTTPDSPMDTGGITIDPQTPNGFYPAEFDNMQSNMGQPQKCESPPSHPGFGEHPQHHYGAGKSSISGDYRMQDRSQILDPRASPYAPGRARVSFEVDQQSQQCMQVYPSGSLGSWDPLRSVSNKPPTSDYHNHEKNQIMQLPSPLHQTPLGSSQEYNIVPKGHINYRESEREFEESLSRVYRGPGSSDDPQSREPLSVLAKVALTPISTEDLCKLILSNKCREVKSVFEREKKIGQRNHFQEGNFIHKETDLLAVVVQHGWFQMVEIMLKYRSEVDLEKLENRYLSSAVYLQTALPSSNPPHELTARQLLNANADPNQKTTDNLYPLTLAILGGNIELVKMLLQFGADPSLPSTAGSLDAMQLAVQACNRALQTNNPDILNFYSIIETIHLTDSSLISKETFKCTPLMTAISCGNINLINEMADIGGESIIENSELALNLAFSLKDEFPDVWMRVCEFADVSDETFGEGNLRPMLEDAKVDEEFINNFRSMQITSVEQVLELSESELKHILPDRNQRVALQSLMEHELPSPKSNQNDEMPSPSRRTLARIRSFNPFRKKEKNDRN